MPRLRILVLLALGAAGPAWGACSLVSSPNALCPAAANPCFIDGKQCPIVSGTTLDFGNRDVELRKGTALDAGAKGIVTINAKSLRIDGGTALLAAGGSIFVNTSGDIGVLNGGAANGRISTADTEVGGQVSLATTGGVVQIDGVIDARGTNTDGAGGSIDVTAQSIAVTGSVLIAGGPLNGGGESTLTATASSVVSGTLDGSGGAGGTVSFLAGDSVTLSGLVDVRATTPASNGGSITVVTNTGPVALSGKALLQGDVGTLIDGSDGGEFEIDAGADVSISGKIDLSGSAADGIGGDGFVRSLLDTVVTSTATLFAQGRGFDSDGGSFEFDSSRGLTIGASISLFGGGDIGIQGGVLQATSWCNLLIPANVTIDASGSAGANLLSAGGQMTIMGKLVAGQQNLLTYLSDVPHTQGATFLPDFDLQQDPSLTPCGGFAPPGCGNGVLDPGETCDDGNTVGCDGCSATCQVEACGNGVVDCGEACDDGNTTGGDGCSADCKTVEFCGDGITQPGLGEQCDDGNTASCDGCSSSCQLEVCGNGVVDCGEECDDGNTIDGDGCSHDCRIIPVGCGNGVLDPGEECDDGNTVDGDGCSHQCRKEVCGNGVVDPGEECDDFNTTGCDGCSPTCKLEVCGNGIVDCGEECDDGPNNGMPGSTCLPGVCFHGPVCTMGAQPGPCIPCGTTIDCDPRNLCGSAECQIAPGDTGGVCVPKAQLVCDDGNACNGLETCDPQTGCQPGVPPACDDGDACNGVETCDPQTGCVRGTPPVCDDGDSCTTDACDPKAGCTNTPLPGFALAFCRVDAARVIVSGAAPGDIAAPIRAKLLKALGVVDGKLQVGQGNPKKLKKAVGAARKQAAHVVAFVTKQRGKKIADPTAQQILEALGVLRPILDGLVP